MRKYAGIGSRETPGEVLAQMEQLGKRFAEHGWLLRSGGADGADSAFERGCDKAEGKKEIFVPWQNFNKSPSPLWPPSEEAMAIASRIHPAWGNCAWNAKMLHARNVHQVLGPKLDDPVDLVICWTKYGSVRGGTSTAIKIARQHNVEVSNLFESPFDWIRLLEMAKIQ